MGKPRPLEKKVKSAQEQGKKGSTECRTQSDWSGGGVREPVVRMDVVMMEGEESQKRKKSRKTQNVDKTREQSGWRGETEMFMSSDKLSQTSALTFAGLQWEVKRVIIW